MTCNGVQEFPPTSVPANRQKKIICMRSVLFSWVFFGWEAKVLVWGYCFATAVQEHTSEPALSVPSRLMALGNFPMESARTVWGFCFNWYCSYWSHLIMRLFSRVSLAEMMISNTWGTGKFLSWWSVLVLFCPVTSPEFQLCLYQSTKRSCSHTHLKSTADIRELGVYFVSCYHFCPECSLETLSVPPVDATCCLTTKWLTSLGPYWFLKL